MIEFHTIIFNMIGIYSTWELFLRRFTIGRPLAAIYIFFSGVCFFFFFRESQEGVRFALEREGERLLFLEGVREYTSKVTPRQKKILAHFFDKEVRPDFVLLLLVLALVLVGRLYI